MPVVAPTHMPYEIHQGNRQSALTKTVIASAWPLVGVGVAMAAMPWLPTDSPALGFVVLAAELVLGAFAVTRLLRLTKN